MNNQQQIVKALSMLQIAYSTDMPKERMKLYVYKLSDINPVTLEQAVNNLILTNDCRNQRGVFRIKCICEYA